jgi:hypothetical protein
LMVKGFTFASIILVIVVLYYYIKNTSWGYLSCDDKVADLQYGIAPWRFSFSH